jgi:ABC-type bacteriocin/lantibiotic exporter with double-glycine peptidase domain
MIPLPPVHTTVPAVPFYSQFADIHSLSWQKVGCGITSLAMIINYYSDDTVSVDTLLKKGIADGAYNTTYGWIHNGLITLAKKYSLNGTSYDVTSLDKDSSLRKLEVYLKDGPVIVSVHYKFDPKSKIPHLIVLDGINGGYIYYNDPAAKTGQKKILVEDFQKGWKKKFIVIRPTGQKLLSQVSV